VTGYSSLDLSATDYDITSGLLDDVIRDTNGGEFNEIPGYL